MIVISNQEVFSNNAILGAYIPYNENNVSQVYELKGSVLYKVQ